MLLYKRSDIVEFCNDPNFRAYIDYAAWAKAEYEYAKLVLDKIKAEVMSRAIAELRQKCENGPNKSLNFPNGDYPAYVPGYVYEPPRLTVAQTIFTNRELRERGIVPPIQFYSQEAPEVTDEEIIAEAFRLANIAKKSADAVANQLAIDKQKAEEELEIQQEAAAERLRTKTYEANLQAAQQKAANDVEIKKVAAERMKAANMLKKHQSDVTKIQTEFITAKNEVISVASRVNNTYPRIETTSDYVNITEYNQNLDEIAALADVAAVATFPSDNTSEITEFEKALKTVTETLTAIKLAEQTQVQLHEAFDNIVNSSVQILALSASDSVASTSVNSVAVNTQDSLFTQYLQKLKQYSKAAEYCKNTVTGFHTEIVALIELDPLKPADADNINEAKTKLGECENALLTLVAKAASFALDAEAKVESARTNFTSGNTAIENTTDADTMMQEARIISENATQLNARIISLYAEADALKSENDNKITELQTAAANFAEKAEVAYSDSRAKFLEQYNLKAKALETAKSYTANIDITKLATEVTDAARECFIQYTSVGKFRDAARDANVRAVAASDIDTAIAAEKEASAALANVVIYAGATIDAAKVTMSAVTEFDRLVATEKATLAISNSADVATLPAQRQTKADATIIRSADDLEDDIAAETIKSAIMQINRLKNGSDRASKLKAVNTTEKDRVKAARDKAQEDYEAPSLDKQSKKSAKLRIDKYHKMYDNMTASKNTRIRITNKNLADNGHVGTIVRKWDVTTPEIEIVLQNKGMAVQSQIFVNVLDFERIPEKIL